MTCTITPSFSLISNSIYMGSPTDVVGYVWCSDYHLKIYLLGLLSFKKQLDLPGFLSYKSKYILFY